MILRLSTRRKARAQRTPMPETPATGDLHERLAGRPGGLRDLACARLRRSVEVALDHAGLQTEKPGRLRVNQLGGMLHDAGYEIEVRAVPAGDPRRKALEGGGLAGDLVGRLTAALLAEPWTDSPRSAHGEHRVYAECALCCGDVDRIAAWVVRFMEPEVLAAEVDRFHHQGERADAARECPAWAWHACACPQQCDPEPASLPRPDTDQQDGEAFTAAVEAGNHDEPLGAWERELLKSKDRETADCGDEHPETGRRCTRPAGHDAHRNGGVGWTYLRDDTIDALSQRAGRAERQRDRFYAELKDAERTLAAVEQICRAATIPPVAELEARLARRILARIEQPTGANAAAPTLGQRAEQAGFVFAVLSLFDKADLHSELFWRADEDELRLYADVSDVFKWGAADLEEITPDRWPILQQAYDDLIAIDSAADLVVLYAARIRRQRPQGAAYPDHPTVRTLLNECGPERPLELGNPRPPAALDQTEET